MVEVEKAKPFRQAHPHPRRRQQMGVKKAGPPLLGQGTC